MRAALLLGVLASACGGHGDPCSRSMRGIDDCAPGLTCTAEAGYSGVCVCASVDPSLRLGDDCGDASSCESCRTDLRCNRASLECIVPRSLPAQSECTEDADCALDLLCGGGSGRCEPPNSHGPGARCMSSRECGPDLACGTDGRCGSPGGDGANCGTTDQCMPGLVCDTPLDPNRCRPPGIVGSLCEDATHCEAGLVCSDWFVPAQCATGAPGSSCLQNTDCQTGSTCIASTCS